MDKKHVSYLDYNATAPVLPAVAEAVTGCLSTFGNPSSMHQSGRKARSTIETARELVAELVSASAPNVIFMSGGTEANALALRGLMTGSGCSSVVASAIEHPSVLAHVPRQDHIPVNGEGQIDLVTLENMLRNRPAPVLVSLMFANNETGVLQPVSDAVDLAKKFDALVHCDAVQAPGKIPINFNELGVDAMSISAHKFGGLKGTGALILRDGLKIDADIPGGGQERNRRSGTENFVGIVAFGTAALHASQSLTSTQNITALRDKLESKILRTLPQAKIFSSGSSRLGNTCCVAIPGLSSETQLIKLDLAGVAVSAGSACSSGKISPSHVLLAMGVRKADANCAIRVSFGPSNTDADVHRFLEVWTPLALNAAT
ncbi:MAG: cysteine desulfurase [Candidatus Marinimicrobia bacterium]|nr:cysteine desulfurase [Candidatus Neomarinimicrobiota bacterium]